MPLFHSQEEYDAHQDELFNDSLSEGAFKQEQVFQYTSLHGQERPDEEWILSPFDTWEHNPHFTGKPGPHPEQDPGDAMKYYVKVNTVTDRPDVWTGNAVEHDTAEAAEEAARDLFSRWMAVKFWRVTDADNNVITTNEKVTQE